MYLVIFVILLSNFCIEFQGPIRIFTPSASSRELPLSQVPDNYQIVVAHALDNDARQIIVMLAWQISQMYLQ